MRNSKYLQNSVRVSHKKIVVNQNSTPVTSRRMTPSPAPVHPGAVVSFQLDDLSDAEDELDADHVVRLATSFEKIGQREPVLILRLADGSYRMANGRRRLAAAKRIGWKQIKAVIIGCSENEEHWLRPLLQLQQRDISALERAGYEAALLSLFYGELAQVAPTDVDPELKPSFRKAAAALGIPRDQLRRSMKIASILPDALIAIRDAKLEDNQSALLDISKGSTLEEQLEIISERISPPSAESVARPKASRCKNPGDPERDVSSVKHVLDLWGRSGVSKQFALLPTQQRLEFLRVLLAKEEGARQ